MATIQNALQIYNAAPPVLETVSRKVQALSVDFAALQQASADSLNVVAFQTAKDKAEAMYQCMEEGIQQADTAQRQLNNTVQKGADAMGNLVGKLTGKLFSAESFEKVMSLSDALGTSRTRLGTMNHLQGEGGLKSTGQVQDRVFESARNSGTSYMDTANTVANLGMTAGSAFGGTEEIIAFAEQMNKQFQIAGLNVEEQRNATDSLVASMAAGGVQGSEFMSMMQNAPMLAQAIADSMGVSVDVLSNMSDQGLITADVIKNAMFASAAATDEAFGNIPMTFERLKSIVGDSLLQTFAPLLETIGQAAQWIYENWSIIAPMMLGAAAAIAVYVVAMYGATWATTAWANAQQVLNAIMAMSPIMQIIMLVVILIGIFYAVIAAINKFAGTSISATGIIAGVFSTLFASLWNVVGSFVNFFANVWTDPIGSIVRLFESMADQVLGVIELIARGIDKVFGSNLASTVSGWRDAIHSVVESKFGDGSEVMKHLDVSGAFDKGYDWGKDFSSQGGNITDIGFDASNFSSTFDEIKSNIADTAGNTAKVANSMDTSTEELKYLRDVAEKEAVNRFTTAALQIDMTNHNKINSEMDLDGVVAHLESKVYETMLVAAEGVYE